MEINKVSTHPRKLFSKEIHRFEIRITLQDAQKLHDRLLTIHGEFGSRGRRARLEVSFIGPIVSQGKGTYILCADGWETPEDKRHFLRGYELAMLLHGMDVTKDMTPADYFL